MFKEIFYENNHMYVAVLENGAFIIAYEDGTAIDLQGRKYIHITEFDENDVMISDGWKLAE